jgi:CHAD domain-containing protein
MQQLGPARIGTFAETTVTRLVTAAPDVDLDGSRGGRAAAKHYAGLDRSPIPLRRFLLTLGQNVAAGAANRQRSAAGSRNRSALADKILARLHRKAFKRGAHFRQLNTNAQHELRIDIKKLRYAAEFFLPLYAAHAPAKRYVKRLARLQVSLGRARDIATTRILLDAVRQDDQPALHLAIGAVAGLQARDRIAVAKTLRKRWRRFKTTPSFWRR